MIKKLLLITVLMSLLAGGVILNRSVEPQIVPYVVAPVTPDYTQSNLLTLTNQERAKEHLPELQEKLELDKAASLKCQDMETRNYWAHSVDGEEFYKFNPDALVYGENLAKNFNSDIEVMNGWMNSPEHKKNILNPLFTLVGFAKCEGPIPHLVVQELERGY